MSLLGALGGAGLAVGGVVLAVVALLSVTEEPGGSPVLADAVLAEPAAPRADVPSDLTVPSAPSVPSDLSVPSTDQAAAAALPATAVVATPAATALPVPAGAPVATPPATSAAAAPRPSAVRAPAARADTRAAARPAVAVLNNSRVTGLADRAATRFERGGWPVRLVGNFRGQLRATTLYYEPGQRAAAQRFAATFGGVQRVLPRAGNIPGPRGLVVVLTRDYA